MSRVWGPIIRLAAAVRAKSPASFKSQSGSRSAREFAMCGSLTSQHVSQTRQLGLVSFAARRMVVQQRSTARRPYSVIWSGVSDASPGKGAPISCA